jgi:hypothetical protein
MQQRNGAYKWNESKCMFYLLLLKHHLFVCKKAGGCARPYKMSFKFAQISIPADLFLYGVGQAYTYLLALMNSVLYSILLLLLLSVFVKVVRMRHVL